MGALYVRRRPRNSCDADARRRTQPVCAPVATHQIVGMGEACRLPAKAGRRVQRLRALRDHFWRRWPRWTACVNGTLDQRVPGIVNVSFEGVDGELLLIALKGLAVSTGSACTSASLEPSCVLKAIGVDDRLAHASVRFSFGRFTSLEGADAAAQVRDAVESCVTVAEDCCAVGVRAPPEVRCMTAKSVDFRWLDRYC